MEDRLSARTQQLQSAFNRVNETNHTNLRELQKTYDNTYIQRAEAFEEKLESAYTKFAQAAESRESMFSRHFLSLSRRLCHHTEVLHDQLADLLVAIRNEIQSGSRRQIWETSLEVQSIKHHIDDALEHTASAESLSDLQLLVNQALTNIESLQEETLACFHHSDNEFEKLNLRLSYSPTKSNIRALEKFAAQGIAGVKNLLNSNYNKTISKVTECCNDTKCSVRSIGNQVVAYSETKTAITSARDDIISKSTTCTTEINSSTTTKEQLLARFTSDTSDLKSTGCPISQWGVEIHN